MTWTASGSSFGGGASRSGKTVLVVVRHPEREAGTPADSRRLSVVQSRHPTGP